MWNFTPELYEGAKELGVPSNADSYQVYQEGIYVGYRYFETRYEDFVMGTGNAGDYDYENLVAFPFGYGISYAEFKWDNMNTRYDSEKDAFEISITITDAGNTDLVYTFTQEQTDTETYSVSESGAEITAKLSAGIDAESL